jgi:uncharacterized integral membrane protein
MIFFLLVGLIVGALTVLFVLQNVTPITVSFFTWHLSASLATILFLTFAVGIIVALFALLPGFIAAELRLRKLRKNNKQLEGEVAAIKANLGAVRPRIDAGQTVVPDPVPHEVESGNNQN